jgi:hypothetical protein
MLRPASRPDYATYESPQPALFAPAPSPSTDLAHEAEKLCARAARKNTSRAYTTAWESFKAFCAEDQRRYRALPASPAALAEYITYLYKDRTCALRTIRQHKSAIRHFHMLAGHLDPNRDARVNAVWRGILIEIDQGEPPLTFAVWQRQVHAVVDRIDADLKALGRFPPTTGRLAAIRDRALVLLLASSARLTTGELHALLAQEIAPEKDGLAMNVRRSPDPVALSRVARLKYGPRGYCPVQALVEWMQQLELDREGAQGPVFRGIDRAGCVLHQAISPRALLGIVKNRCAAAGVDPASISLRALRSGSMMQGGYDGERVEDVLESAGLGDDSATRVGAMVERGRMLKEKKQRPPMGVDAMRTGPDRVLHRPRRLRA